MMGSLKGQFLVAMPGMSDPRFQESVVYMVGHSDDGAMGLVVNQGLDDMSLADILIELDLSDPDDLIKLPPRVLDCDVLRGGPVEKGRGFVLHTPDYFRDGNSYAVNEEITLTATLDVLKAMMFGPSPERALLALGYCGWSPGQLETEILDNGWLTVPHSTDLLFGVPLAKRYESALGKLGVTRASLSSEAGRA